jgi:hypothetical protein
MNLNFLYRYLLGETSPLSYDKAWVIYYRLMIIIIKIPVILTDPRTHQTPQQFPRNRGDRGDHTNNTIGLQKKKQPPRRHHTIIARIHPNFYYLSPTYI